MPLNLAFTEPNLFALAERFGAGARTVYCSLLFERTGANQIVARALRSPLEPGLYEDLDAARAFFTARRCPEILAVIASAIDNVRSARAQLAAAQAAAQAEEEARRRALLPSRPLGKRFPAPAPSPVRESVRLRGQIHRALLTGAPRRVVEVLRNQLALALARGA